MSQRCLVGTVTADWNVTDPGRLASLAPDPVVAEFCIVGRPPLWNGQDPRGHPGDDDPREGAPVDACPQATALFS